MKIRKITKKEAGTPGIGWAAPSVLTTGKLDLHLHVRGEYAGRSADVGYQPAKTTNTPAIPGCRALNDWRPFERPRVLILSRWLRRKPI